jgi:hypothetical protein
MRDRALALGCLAALAAACFGGVLFGDHQFGYRDAGYFYYPLYLRVQQEWQAGRWPLWVPEANGGMPLLGNPSAAVLYPGKLVFGLLAYPWAARVYIITHVVLAYGAMWTLLRGWSVSATGASLGALAYAFGAPVLALTSNVVFLVGAAWAPLGFLAADRCVRLRRPGAVPGLALVLAMQTLGGDPEAAYVTVVCAMGYAAGLAAARGPHRLGLVLIRLAVVLVPVYLGLLALWWWSARAPLAVSSAPAGPAPFVAPPPRGVVVAIIWTAVAAIVYARLRGSSATSRLGLGPALAGLLGASGLGLLAAAAQVLPVLEFLRLSGRAAEFEAAYDIYRFGLHPLHVLDGIWPNLFGTVDHGNHSWILALPLTRDAQLWIPSLYLGGLTLVLAAVAAGFRGEPVWRAWLTWVAVLSLLASLGAHGSPLFWLRSLHPSSAWLGPPEWPPVPRFRTDGFLRDGDSGVYWFLAAGLPLFEAFRFPAKFLVFTVLAVSALAGLAWDRLIAGRSRRVEIVAGGFLAVSLVLLGLSWLGAGPLRIWLQAVAKSRPSINGPLDVAGALADLRAAFTHGAIIMAVALALAATARRWPGPAGLVAMLVLVVDLALANSRHMVTVPQAVFEGTPGVWKAIEEAERAAPANGPFRVQRFGSWAPREWSRRASSRRAEEIVGWERATLRPLHGLPIGASTTFFLGTAELFDYGLFFFPSFVPTNGRNVFVYPRRGFDLWATRYFVVPGTLVADSPDRGYASLLARSTPIDVPAGVEDVRILRNEAALPRAWIVHQARVVPPIGGQRTTERRALTEEMLYQDDAFWHVPGRRVYDPRVLAWVETDEPGALAPFLPEMTPAPDPSETVTITRDNPQRVELTAVLRKPGLVVLADVYYPGWSLAVDGRPVAILRTNRAMRGAPLAAGTHHLVFRYSPTSFRVGLPCSAIGIGLLAALGVRAARKSIPPAQ